MRNKGTTLEVEDSVIVQKSRIVLVRNWNGKVGFVPGQRPEDLCPEDR